MPIGAVGASVLSDLYQSLQKAGTSPGTTPPSASGTTQATASLFGAAPDTSVNTAPLSLTVPQPPSNQTPISQAASKLIADFKSLLLNVQADAGAASSATPSTSAAAGTAASATPASATATTTDPATTLANDLATLSGDLQKAGGGHHHHHHHGGDGGAGGNDATNATTPTATASAATTGTQPSAASDGLLAQFTKALNAYAASGSSSAGSANTNALSSTLLTA